MIATMNAVRVAIGVEAFWGTVRSLETLALILQTCRSVRAECGVAFAVAAMGRDRRVQKAWARRWLGVRAGWWARGGAVTLVGALRLAERHRSVGAAEAHRLADARYMRRLAAFQEKGRRRAALHAYFERRAERLRAVKRMVTEAGLPVGGPYYDLLARGDVDDPIDLTVLRRYHARKAELDERVSARERGSEHYVACLLAVSEPVTEAMVTEIAFRQTLQGNPDFRQLIMRFRRRGHESDAAVTRARDVFRKQYLCRYFKKKKKKGGAARPAP